MTPPFSMSRSRRSLGVRHARTPYIYTSEQEQPHHVDEMPVPGGKFETEMLFRTEMPRHRAQQTNYQEDRTDDNVRAMEARRHEERGTVDVAAEVEGRVRILVSLHTGESEPQQDGKDEAPFEPLPVVFQKRMMRPGNGRAGGEQDQRIEQRQMPGVECLDAFRGPYATGDCNPPNVMDVAGKQGGVEIGPEPRDEEHDLRRNKQDHPVAMRYLHDPRVEAVELRFTDYIPPP